MRNLFLFGGLVTCLIANQTIAAASPLDGYWKGVATRNGGSTPLILEFSTESGELQGTMSLPEYGMLGRPADSIELDGANVSVLFGPTTKFSGTLSQGVLWGTGTNTRPPFKADFRVESVPDPRPYTEENVTFRNGDITLAGTVFVPKSGGTHPGIALIHGSGTAQRSRVENIADWFARAGLAVIFFDKRGSGESGGNWRQVGFEPLACDGLAALDVMKARDDVDPERLGFWGISQAGWIMPLAASLSGDVSFIVTTSGPSVTVAEEGLYDYAVQLRDKGHSQEIIDKAINIIEMDYAVTRGEKELKDVFDAIAEVRDEPWFKDFGFVAPPVNHPGRKFMGLILDHDPVPILEEIDIPILWIYGEEDKSVEPERNISILQDIQREYEKDYTIKRFPNADHGIDVPPGPDFVLPFERPAEGYRETMIEWVREQTGLVEE